MEARGKIFDIKQFAVHDGPGIRTTVFFKGCPLECWWCHNPEGMQISNEIFYYEFKCMKCQSCIDSCPLDAIIDRGDRIEIQRDKCNSCGDCIEVCPTAALQLVGKSVSVEEVIDEIRKSIIYYDTSGGGVTFSGGEPLMQPEFLMALIQGCREEKIHITLDTSGYVSSRVFGSIVDKVDLFLYDLKLISDEKHMRYTGKTNKPALENLRTLAQKGRGKDVIIRFPVIPDITDSEEDIGEIIEFISTIRGIQEVDLLPFHNVWEKYKRLGKEYKVDNNSSPSMDRLEDIKAKFEKEGFYVKIGG